MNILDIANSFTIKKAEKVAPYGNGHINQTFLVEAKNNKYILQRINTNLFTRPDKLMDNLTAVTAHIAKKRGAEHTLTVVPTADGANYLEADGAAYRMFEFIDGVGYDSATPELFRLSAVAFGQFGHDLNDFDAKVLYEVLPDFHNTQNRLRLFKQALEADSFGRAASVKAEIDFVLSHSALADQFVPRLHSGELPLRVTHNDTKLNNVLLDKVTGEIKAVIDLDTVMPGTVCYDFGDSIRFGCNTGAEDEPDLSKVDFSKDLYDRYFDGYTSAFVGLTDAEAKMLPMGAAVMTYECGMRFLTDYLSGDTYFRTHREGQNLDRARTQFKLVKLMEDKIL